MPSLRGKVENARGRCWGDGDLQTGKANNTENGNYFPPSFL